MNQQPSQALSFIPTPWAAVVAQKFVEKVRF